MSQPPLSHSKFEIGRFKLADFRRDIVFLARFAHGAGRYDEMCKLMNALVRELHAQRHNELTPDERRLLSAAYGGLFEARRDFWRSFALPEHRDDALLGQYKAMVEEEMESIAQELLDLVQQWVKPKASGLDDEAVAFFELLTADFFGHLARFIAGKGHEAQATTRYQSASDLAHSRFGPTHPLRLEVDLHFALFCEEVLKDHQQAIQRAKMAYDGAISQLDRLDDATAERVIPLVSALGDFLARST